MLSSGGSRGDKECILEVLQYLEVVIWDHLASCLVSKPRLVKVRIGYPKLIEEQVLRTKWAFQTVRYPLSASLVLLSCRS